MVIPIGDVNPARRTPWINRLLLLANIGIFVFVQPWSAPACDQVEFFLRWAAVPVEIVEGEPLDAAELQTTPAAHCPDVGEMRDKGVYFSVLASMFLHGSWLHLLGNMLYLWIFGNNVEDRLGHLRYLVFYVVCGFVATIVFVVPNAGSTATLVGASGAIAGVLGAYLVMYPTAPVAVAVPFLLFLVFHLPAVIVLGLWFVLQLFPLRDPELTGGGVAYLAHVGGFVAGMVITLLLGYRPQRVRRR